MWKNEPFKVNYKDKIDFVKKRLKIVSKTFNN